MEAGGLDGASRPGYRGGEAATRAAWIHGHLHWSFDYRVGPTRVLCNPRGYPGEPTGAFDPALVVELDACG